MKSNKEDKLYIKVAIKIKLERTKRGLSQEKLAELADLSKTYVGDIERTKSIPTLDTIEKIAKALDMEVIELIDVSKMSL